RRGRLAHRGVRARRPARPRRHGQDRGRRLRRGEDPRVSLAEEGVVKTLVFLEHHEGALQKDSLGVLSKAASLDGEVEAVLLGSGVEGLAGEAGKYGAARVHVADDSRLEAPLPQPRVDVLETLVGER